MSYKNDGDKSSSNGNVLSFSDLLKEEPSAELLERWRKQDEERDKAMNEHLMKSQEIWYTSLSRNDIDTKSWANLDVNSKELEEAARAVKAWSPDCDFGIFLYGKPGNGKTHMMKALIIDHFSRSRQFMFRTCSDIMAEFKDFENKEYYHRKLSEPYGLVLDDFGTERGSEYEQNELFRLIENRIKSGNPVFMTSNLSMTQLKEKYSERIVSRLGQMMAFVENKAPSHRAKIFQKNQKQLLEKSKCVLLPHEEMKRLAEEDTLTLVQGSFGE